MQHFYHKMIKKYKAICSGLCYNMHRKQEAVRREGAAAGLQQNSFSIIFKEETLCQF